MKSLRSAFATLQQEEVEVIGVSLDSVADQRAFSDKFQLPFALLSDRSGALCDLFGIAHPSGKPKRETFLFKNGALLAHDKAPNPRRQAEAVLLSIREFSSASN